MPKILYLGLDVPSEFQDKEITHCPLIRIVPRSKEQAEIVQAFLNFSEFTHLIFTSKNGVKIFFDFALAKGISAENLNEKIYLSVGKKTTEQLKKCGVDKILTAREETAEGVIALLSSLNLAGCNIFWPHSALSRPLLKLWLQQKRENEIRSNFKLNYYTCPVYDTFLNTPEKLTDILSYDEIIFTSPSTVDAFCSIFGSLPVDKVLTCIGPITQKYLETKLKPNIDHRAGIKI